MNLCDRLQRPTPCGYGQQYYFQIRGLYGSHKSLLITEVVERYSKIFGPVTRAKANVMYERLARKYCRGNHWASLRGIECVGHPHDIEHPASMRMSACAARLIRSTVESETKYTDHDFCWIDSTVRDCSVCGGVTQYDLKTDRLPKVRTRCYRHTRGLPFVCRNALCKALVQQFPSAFTRKKQMLPMAFVLLEVTKNGDRSGAIEAVKEIASRDVYRTHNRGRIQGRGKDHRPHGERISHHIST